jgi:hypothetical protein
MLAKGNQPQLEADIATEFSTPPARDEAPWLTATTRDRGHGRLERRTLTASTALAGYLDWPGARQVFRLERRVVEVTTGVVREETVYGVTDLAPRQAGPRQLLALVRGQWRIENWSHWTRDVGFDEDRSQVRVGSIPQVMAALRNTVLGLLRSTGERQIAATTRRCQAQPWQALRLLGINRDN